MSHSTITDLPQYSDPTSSTDRLDESQSESQPSHDETSVTLPDPWATEDGVIAEPTPPQDKVGDDYPPYSDAAPNARSQLTEPHYNHLCSEGFKDHLYILLTLGIRSVTKQEAEVMGYWTGVDGRPQTNSGILFPFTKDFAQLRPDRDEAADKGKDKDKIFPKYFGKAGVKTEAYLPPGFKVVTEGLKDALACSIFGGIPTGAISGVSCFSSDLEKDSKITLLFDSDGWWNPSVFEQLIKGGKHVGGKIQLIPKMPEDSKAGACEYFKEGFDSISFAELIAAAMSIEEFMFELPRHWSGLDLIKLHDCAHKLARVACEHLKPHRLEALLQVLKKIRIPIAALRATIKDFKAQQGTEQAAEREKARREKVEQSNGVLIEMEDNGHGKFAPPAQGAVATAIATALKDSLGYDAVSTKFFEYAAEIPGVWSSELVELSHRRIAKILDENGAEGNYAQNFVSGVHLLMRGAIVVREEEWGNDRKLIPFKNGVLDTRESKLLPHDPAFRLCWALPFDYDQGATCEPILEWLLEVNSGYADRVQLCRAWLKAILTGGSRFQKFLFLVGAGGTGKTTFMNLVEACLGQINVAVSDVVTLETNRFETANLRNKRLLCIHECHKFAGDITVLKNATGQSPLRFELKGVQAMNSFIFQGMVMLSGNEDLRSNESTSALSRRKILLPFTNVCPDDKKRDLIGKDERGNPTGEFAPYLTGLINWALEMPDSDMTAFISQTSRMVPSIQEHAAESLTDTNPIAGWLDECCFAMADTKTYIGKISQDKDIFLRDKELYLYPSYAAFCLQRGNKPTTLSRFSGLVLDLLNHQLKVVATKGRDSKGFYIRGIGLRGLGTDEPRMVTELPKMKASVGSVEESVDLVKASVGLVKAETLAGVGSEDYVGFSSVTHDGKKKEKGLNDLDQPLDETLSVGETLSSETIYFPENIQGVGETLHSLHALHPTGFQPTQTLHQPYTEPTLSGEVDWLSAESIEGMILAAKDLYAAGTPELIESCLIAVVPSSLQDQIRKLITDAANPFKQADLLD